MIRKKILEKCGYFNENYLTCFEDVELNISCLSLGYENYNDSNLVAYHYESQTRKDDSEDIKKQHYDYHKNLLPFVMKNIDKIKNKIIIE
jgi:GT2 family glycosyltransferase